MSGRASALACFVAGAVWAAEVVHAQEEEVPLSALYDALAEQRLLSRETGSTFELARMLRAAEDHVAREQWEEASRVLWEAVYSPRFSDYQETEDHRQAEFLLAGTLAELGALRSSFRVLVGILSRGPGDPYFGPGLARAVDVALESEDPAGSAERLEALIGASGTPSDDVANELHYLRGRAAYDADNAQTAEQSLANVTRQSRWYGNAQYLRGVVAAMAGQLDEAETRFCSIATRSDSDRFTFYVDRRYFEIRDLTWLALGRVAHEGRRRDDAFYYYFQVPNDSARVSEALFEAAWSMYEGGDAETAVDLLDQLKARFPNSPFVDEASLLRGYVHLARCEFEEADREFVQFDRRFGGLTEELDRVLASPSRRQHLVEELLAAELREPSPPPAEGDTAAAEDGTRLLLRLLVVEPAFYRVYRQLRTLDAEAARAGNLGEEIELIGYRMAGRDAPMPATGAEPSDTEQRRALLLDLERAAAGVDALTAQLDAMRAAGASREQIDPLDAELRGFEQRVSRLRAQASRVTVSGLASDVQLPALLEAERTRANSFASRVSAVRSRLIEAANDLATAAIQRLRERLASSLRRARIGRIDAVMGSKRRIEIQIESLAAGRFPAELQDPLRIQGLLRDDEEYWPFEGEYWEDEYEEPGDDE